MIDHAREDTPVEACGYLAAGDENVPGSLKREGHEILRQQQGEDTGWSLLVRKND